MDSPLFPKNASGRLIIGALLGCMTGLAFGPDVSALAPLGHALLTLIKIAAIPYLFFLVARASINITPGYAWPLFKHCLVGVAITWAILISSVELLFLMSPTVHAAPGSMRSMADVLALARLSPETMVVSMVYNVVPVLLIFGLLLGLALVKERQSVAALGFLDRAIGALERLLRWLAVIVPIGVFAIVAERFGGDAAWLPAFMRPWMLFSYLGSFTLGLVTFPGLIWALTPLSGRFIAARLWPILFLALSSGSLLITLPYLTSAVKHLFHPKASSEESTATELAVPLLFNVPMGHLMLILAILFTAGYSGMAFDIPAHIKAILLGLLATFGSPLSATIFLTKQLELLPETALIIMAAWPTIRPGIALLGASVLMALAISAIYSSEKRLNINFKMLIAVAALSIAIVTLLGWGINQLFI